MNYFKRRLLAFGYAVSGLFQAVRAETHLKVHVMAAVLVGLAGWHYRISRTEWLAVALSVALVISLELINSAIERLCDRFTTAHHPDIKYIKDVAAAAVLVASAMALVVGALVFLPYVL